HLCATYNERTIHVENADELDLSLFEGVEEVGVASGLSTPPNLVEDVVARLYRASGGTPLHGAQAAHPPSAGTRGGPLSDLPERRVPCCSGARTRCWPWGLPARCRPHCGRAICWLPPKSSTRRAGAGRRTPNGWPLSGMARG